MQSPPKTLSEKATADALSRRTQSRGFRYAERPGCRSEDRLNSKLLLILFLTLISLPIQAQKRAGRPAPVLVDEIGSTAGKRPAEGRAERAARLRKGISASPIERDVFELLNAERSERKLPALVWDDTLAEVARKHSQNMANKKFFSHRGEDGSLVDDRAQKLGIFNWRAIGENIAFLQGYDNPAELAVERWMNSPGHRKNVLEEKWTQSAVGVAIGPDGSYYFTQVFLLR